MVCLTTLLLALLAFNSPGQEKDKKTKSKPDASAAFFESTNVPRLRIEIGKANYDALRADNRKYVRCTMREGETAYHDVGVHLKGAAGSLRDLNDRPALTLNFDKFVEDQKFHGMDKLHLNNSVQDPSYMTEILCGEMFRAADVPAARGTHVTVELNGRDLGLYVLKEGFDKTFLKRYFKNAKGNLYDAGFIKEITDPLEKDSGEGDVSDHADLKALANAAEEPDTSKRFELLQQRLDLNRFISFVAMEVMTWHWDGYSLHKNNYRVYHQPDVDKIVFLAHGMDQMFWAPSGSIRPDMQGLVARALLETPDGRRLYRQRFGELFTNVFKVELLTNRINELQKRIRLGLPPKAIKEQDGQAQRLRDLVTQRAASIQQQLNTPEPVPLKFASGTALIAGWKPQSQIGDAALDESSSNNALHIRAQGQTIASWRATVLLDPGKYRFEARVRTADVKGISDEKGEGAGLRISGSQARRSNHAAGDSDWQILTYEFNVTNPSQEVVLVAELRASKGDAWFEKGSLRLVQW
jgi:spore coat protein H